MTVSSKMSVGYTDNIKTWVILLCIIEWYKAIFETLKHQHNIFYSCNIREILAILFWNILQNNLIRGKLLNRKSRFKFVWVLEMLCQISWQNWLQ